LMRCKLLTSCFLATFACFRPAFAQTNAVRNLTLQECVQMAIERNLDIRIEQFRPQFDQYTLQGLYGYYEPAFSFEARENFNSSPGNFNPSSGFTVPPNETYTETYSAGFTGVLPSGLTYDVGSDLQRRSGFAF